MVFWLKNHRIFRNSTSGKSEVLYEDVRIDDIKNCFAPCSGSMLLIVCMAQAMILIASPYKNCTRLKAKVRD